MAEYQITGWRELPSLVTAREDDTVVKVPMPQRFQEAIDEAAMRLGAVSSEAYLDGWRRGDWTAGAGAPADLAAHVAGDLERQWPAEAVARFLDDLGPGPGDPT